jgi:DNA methylase
MPLEGVTIGDGSSAPAAGSSGVLSGVTIGDSAPVNAAPPATPAKLPGGSASLLEAPAGAPAPNLSQGTVPMNQPTIKPAPDTTNLFSKFMGFASGAVSKVSDAISNATTEPTLSQLPNGGKNTTLNTLAYLPSQLARQIPGVAELQDDPSIAQYVTPSEVAQSVPGAVGSTVQGFIKAPITAVADLYDAGRVFLGKNPNAAFNIPGLGKVTSDEYNVAQAVQQGEDPVTAVLNSGSSSIFNALFFADLVNRVASPTSVKVAETTGNINDLTKPTGTGPRPVIDAGPKSGRLYEQPTAYNKGGAQVLPPDMLAKMKEQGITLGSRFKPEQPVYFKVTVGKGGEYVGSIMQLKPSYLSQAMDAIFGKKGGSETTVPALLGESSPVPDSKAITPADLAPAATAAKPEDSVVLHSQTVNEGDIKSSMNNTLMGKDQSQQPATTEQPKAPPALPSTTETVVHNILRLGEGDVTKAKEGATLLQTDIKAAVDQHGPMLVHQALQEKIGVDAPTADKLIKEAQAPKTPAEVKALAQTILKNVSPETAARATAERMAKTGALHEQITSAVQSEHGIEQAGAKQIASTAIEKITGTKGATPSNTVTPPSLAALQLEAKKYKSVDEFRQAINDAMRGRIGDLPKEKQPEASALRQMFREHANDMLSKKQLPSIEKIYEDAHMTQKEKVKAAVKNKPLPIKDVAKLTNILEPNVRRILGEGTKEGTFERVKEGVYVLKTKTGTFAYVEMGDAVDSLAQMAEEGLKFDSVILDPAYFSRALIGGNRGIKKWNFIMPEDFAKVMDSVSKLMKHDDSHVYLMLSGARTAQPDMTRYVDAATAAGFKAVGEGEYHKLFQNGAPVTNVRGEIAAPERMILLSKSGTARAGEIATTLNFQYIRPAVAKSYQTEKPAELMKALIQQSTIRGETVLDPFAGSGVTGAEALKSGRNSVSVEKSADTVENFTKPRIEAAAKEIDENAPVGNAKELTVKPEDLTVKVAEKTQEILERQFDNNPAFKDRAESMARAEVKNNVEIGGEKLPRPEQVVSKSDLRAMIKGMKDGKAEFTIAEKNGAKVMEFTGRGTHLVLKPSALGIVDANLNVGDKITINADDLKEKGTALRAVGSEGGKVVEYGNTPSRSKPRKVVEENQPPAPKQLEAQRGFIAPAKIAEDVKSNIEHLHDAIEHSIQVGEIQGEISQSIYKSEGARTAMKVRLTNLVNEARKGSTPAERENVYHYMEDSSVELTEKERTEILPLVDEMDRVLTNLRAEARAAGIYITGDILDEHTPRNAMEKGGVIDKALEAYQAGKKAILRNGGSLSKSVGSGSKHRVFHILTNEDGTRTVVSIKGGKVTAFNKGVMTELGTTDKIVSPKVKEFFDESVMTKLNKLAEDLGVTHERHATGKTEGLGPQRAGVSFGGADLIKTRLGPTSILAHELGHQIDHKYGMQEKLKEETFDKQHQLEVQKEMRDLADKRFEGRNVSDNFKKYVRKGSEKMAVQFEAYIANRNMFKEVAPHLYDDFRQFLSEHEELRPFLDIQPSVSLGSQTHGGELKSGIAGKEFVDNNGQSHIVGQATTKEIEANTSTKYYKDPLANYALAIERTANAVRAARLLEQIKTSPQYKNVIMQKDEPNIPTDFKTTNLPQFRDYFMEPRLAEAFNDLQKRQEGGFYIPVYDEINNLLISTLVINPIMHFPNVAVGWGSSMAADGVPFKVDFGQTLKEVVNKSPDYLDWLEHGAPFQYLRQTNAEFADAMLKDFIDNVQREPNLYKDIADKLGYANPVEWVKGLEKLSADATWIGNDTMLYHALKEYSRAYGVDKETAIKEVSKRMADYRIPPRVLGLRALSVAMQNNAILMFMRYHYSGVLKPWVENAWDSARPGASKAQRLSAARTLAYFAALWFIYQGADKLLQKGLNNPNAYIGMGGAMKLPQNIQRGFQANSPIPVITGELSLTPSAKIAGSILDGGYDISNFMKPIFGPGGEGLGTFAGNVASPYNAISGAFSGTGSWTDYALSLGGVYIPKTTVPTQTLNSMLNLEKPQVEAQMKADIAAGNTAAATALAHDFNTRLQVAIQQADVSNGNSGDAARVAYFFTQYPNGLGQKGYAIRMPSAQTMKNYEAKQGLTTGQKLLPGQANSSSAKGKPSDITNHSDPGTVAGITPNGVTLYNRMSNESAVKAEMEGGKIQPGTQLDHIVPLEGGGTNIIDNIQIISTQEDAINQPVEDFIGQHVKAGTMSLAQATEISVRFKAGLGQKLTPSLMALYTGKYGSQPLTLAQVYDYVHTVGQ